MTPLAEEFLSEVIAADAAVGAPRPRIAEIQAVVAAYYEITVLDLISERRAVTFARPRQVAMYLAKRLTVHSLPRIGQLFGNRDHSTVIHAVRRIEALALADADMAHDLVALAPLVAATVELRLAEAVH